MNLITKFIAILSVIIIFVLFNIYVSSKEEELSGKIEFKGTEMVLVPAGDFWMGSQIAQGELDEHPQHKVYLDNYYIDKYEVTNAQYCQFLNAKGNHRSKDEWWLVIQDKTCLIELKNKSYSPKAGYENYPVISVTWKGAQMYAEWLGKRLPSEAEWEKAAKGTEGYLYPWGMEWSTDKCNNKNLKTDSVTKKMLDFYSGRGIIPVGIIPEDISPYGVMDMAGNVMEWCSDWYDENYYKVSPYKNPQGNKTGKYKVLRGGSWESDNPEDFRCNKRYTSEFDRGFGIGFRCVLSTKKR